MSTQLYPRDQEVRYSQAPNRRAPRKQRGPSWSRIWLVVVGTVSAAALVVLAVVLLIGHSSTAPATAGSSTSRPLRPIQRPRSPPPTPSPRSSPRPQ